MQDTVTKNLQNVDAEMPFISVIVPVYNEERYIALCVDSMLRQKYPRERMEWFFVDGMSADRTVAILQEYQANHPGLITILPNPKRTAPCAVNIGIKASRGSYIIRLDAHAEYEPAYLSKCVHCLNTVDADNVGGYFRTTGRDFVSNTIAGVLSSPFGVGDARFRIDGHSGYVDTVPFGAFRRETFEKYGLFDERLSRNEDNEINHRIRKNGGKVYLSKDIYLTYYCRENISSLTKMAMANGIWNIFSLKRQPGSMGIRHFVPFVFVLSLIILPLLSLLSSFFLYLLFVELGLYLLLDLFFSIRTAADFKSFPLSFFLFPCFHISYGFGSIVGLFKLPGQAKLLGEQTIEPLEKL